MAYFDKLRYKRFYVLYFIDKVLEPTPPYPRLRAPKRTQILQG